MCKKNSWLIWIYEKREKPYWYRPAELQKIIFHKKNIIKIP